MKRLGLVIFLASLQGPLWPAVLSFSPSSQTASGGQTVTVDIVISGLSAGAPPSVGAFDLDVSFDPAILLPIDVTFGSFLGTPGIDALTDFLLSPGVVDLAEVSLLAPINLDAHPASFSLATLSFVAVGVGTSPLAFSQIVVDDAFGDKIPTTGVDGSITGIPEPASALLSGAGLLLIALARCWLRSIRRSARSGDRRHPDLYRLAAAAPLPMVAFKFLSVPKNCL